MAIEKTIQKTIPAFEQTVEAKAYWKIDSLNGNKEGIDIKMNAYVNGKQVDGTSSIFVPDLSGDNFIKQAYEHMKTLPEFADATDV